MKKYPLSLKDFAVPSPKEGSIDTYSGFGMGPLRGIKIHQEIQLRLQQENSGYEAEVPITHTFVFQKMAFQVTGRMDGIYREDLTIEEIKTAFEPNKLIDLLTETHYTHPYWLQLQTYGYILWLKTNKIPRLRLLVVSVRNKKARSLEMDLDIAAYENWLDRRLNDLVLEVKDYKKRVTHRIKQSKNLLFPFENPRPSQNELMETLTEQMSKSRPTLLQAPTGLGKTTGVLFPVLKESLSRGQKTLYLTPKNSQHQIAVNAVHHLQKKGAKFKSLVLTSKKKLCMKNEPLCNSKFCEFAKDHYSKLSEGEVLTRVKKQKNLGAPFFIKMAKTHRICPYELQMDSIPYFEVVIGDYNYVFSPQNQEPRIAKLHFSETEKVNLIVDETHNLLSRSLEHYSPSLHLDNFKAVLNSLKQLPEILAHKLEVCLRQCMDLILNTATPGLYKPHRITIPLNLFKRQEEILHELMNDYLEADVPIESEDPILKLSNYWTDFVAALEVIEGNEAFFCSFNTRNSSIKITCCDASQFLKEYYAAFKQVIGFSATLKPFNYYSQLLGLPTYRHTQEFKSPFPKARRKLIVIPQISTKYSERSRNYPKMVEAVLRIIALKEGNYFLFFPSFEFLNILYKQFKPLTGYSFLKQERGMGGAEVKDLLERLKRPGANHLFFAVQGGMFAEGIDYVGDQAIGAFIVGPPLPVFDWEREQMKIYYEQRYQAGAEYAYIYPAMAKAIQSAGRVIRSETDKGLIVLFDNRFLLDSYTQCMPEDWFEESPKELVSQSILKQVQDFWNSLERPASYEENSISLEPEQIIQ